MKTQIITLETHDDLISVRDRMSWAKTPRILLVWPKAMQVSLRPLDLKVLQRHAQGLGAQLGVVTRRWLVRREAEALGMPVFKSTAAAQKEAWPPRAERKRIAWRPPRKDLRALRGRSIPVEGAWRSNPFVRALAFAAGVLAVLFVAGAFLPRASITLHPESQTQELVLPVTASTAIQSVLVSGGVPAHEEKVILSGSKSISVASRITVPQTAAQGVVRFRNLTQEAVTLPQGTVVSTAAAEPVRFRTLNQTFLAAGPGQFVEAPVEAMQPGTGGNVEAGSIILLEGPLGLQAVVENHEATAGGSNQSVIGPSETDRAGLRAQLLQELQSQAREQLLEQIPSSELALEDTLAVSQTLEERYSPAEGGAGLTLSLDLRVEFSMQAVSQSDLASLAEGALNAAAPQGFAPVADSLSFEPVSKINTDEEGVTHWQMRASCKLLHSVEAAGVLERVRGHSAKSARAALNAAYEWERPPEIALSPSWWPWMPLLPFSTSVDLR